MERSSILLLVKNGHQICIKCTNADVRLRAPDDGQKRLPETCRVVVPIRLEFSASVGFIHKEFITMHGDCCYYYYIIIIIIIIITFIIGIQPLGQFGHRPELSQATGMALVRCILGTFLGVVCH